MSFQELVLIGFYIIILMYSIIIHEVSHGLVALWQGDKTALYAGRITANPIKHIDPMWTIAIPIMMLIFSGGKFAFGGAKPVPFNPYNLRNQKWGSALVALGGPLSNISIALAFAIMARFIPIQTALKADIISNLGNWSALSTMISGSLSAILFTIFSMVILWNVLLAFFNLIPIPPLDGSKLLFAVFKVKTETMIMLEQFGFMFLIIFIFAFSFLLGPFLDFLWSLFFSITI
jgi:Zn-dependent protease